MTATLTLTLAILFVQCDTEASRREKAEDLIKQDLFETLPDYKSYELVSTNQRDGSFGLYIPKAYRKNRPFGLHLQSQRP